MPCFSLFTFVLYFFHSFMLLCICFPYSLHSPPAVFRAFPWFYVIMYSFRNLYSLSLANFRSLPHTPHLFTVQHFPFPTPARGSLPQPHTYTMFYSTYTSVPLLLSHLYSIHIPHSHNHNTIQSFPFTGTHNTAPLLSLNYLHQPHWDPNRSLPRYSCSAKVWRNTPLERTNQV